MNKGTFQSLFHFPYVINNNLCVFVVQYNESEPGKPADWKELIDVSKQDGSQPHLAIAERNVVHIVVDHFTGFAVTGGQPGSTKQAMKPVKIVAYVTQPEADGDCAVRVYCVSDTPAHLEVCHVGTMPFSIYIVKCIVSSLKLPPQMSSLGGKGPYKLFQHFTNMKMLDERSVQTVSTPLNIFESKGNVVWMLNESLNHCKFDSTRF